LDEGRQSLAFHKKVKIEDIHDYEVRSPLQQLIQVLKRHRDVQFPEDDDKPISIIITTLAASVYQNEPMVSEALLAVVPKMRSELIRNKKDGEWRVLNPVNPKENFADKWAESPRKATVFFEWLDLIEKQHKELLTEPGFDKIGEYLTEAFGAREASAALEKYTKRSSRRTLLTSDIESPLGESIQELTSFDVPQRQKPIWEFVASGNATITAQWKRTGGWHPLKNNGTYIIRGSNLRFTATTNVTGPYQIFWQVVNTGREARSKRKLRGEFFQFAESDPSPSVHSEIAEFRGRHWIQCFIYKSGRFVAKSEEFVVNVV
jgi:hypothetical protein